MKRSDIHLTLFDASQLTASPAAVEETIIAHDRSSWKKSMSMCSEICYMLCFVGGRLQAG